MAEPPPPHAPKPPKLISPKTQALQEKRKRAMAGGGPEREKAQRAAGKLTARERLEFLLDDDSFEEVDLLVEKRCHDFGLQDKYLAADGVVTGFGRINGRNVCVYSQDFTVM